MNEKANYIFAEAPPDMPLQEWIDLQLQRLITVDPSSSNSPVAALRIEDPDLMEKLHHIEHVRLQALTSLSAKLPESKIRRTQRCFQVSVCFWNAYSYSLTQLTIRSNWLRTCCHMSATVARCLLLQTRRTLWSCDWKAWTRMWAAHSRSCRR